MGCLFLAAQFTLDLPAVKAQGGWEGGVRRTCVRQHAGQGLDAWLAGFLGVTRVSSHVQ